MQKMQTPLWRRGLRGLRNVRLIVYVIIGLWAAISLVVHGLNADSHNTHDIGSGFGLLLLVFALPALVYWSAQRKLNRSPAAQMPATMDLGSTGLTTTRADSTTTFQPWSDFITFRQGQHTVVLTRPGKAPDEFIPLDGMDLTTQGAMRSILLSNLPERL